MLLSHLNKDEFDTITALLAWTGVVGSMLPSESQRHLRIATTGVVIDADANEVPLRGLLSVLIAVVAVVLRDDWYDPSKDFGANNEHLRKLVTTSVAEYGEDILAATREFADFFEHLSEQGRDAVAAQFRDDIFPKMALMADHVFDDDVGH